MPAEEVAAQAPEESYEVTHEVSATFYTADCEGCSGITSTGINVRNRITNDEGLRVIAVSPTQIPLGSTVRVMLDNGDSFTAVAGDIGGAITHGKIDVLVATNVADEKLGGVEREYIEEPGRKASVGDYVYITEYADEPEDVVAKIDRIDKYNDFIAFKADSSLERFDLDEDDVGDVFTVLSPTNIVRIGEIRYELADRQAEVGEKVMWLYNGESDGIVNTVTDVGLTMVDVEERDFVGIDHGAYVVLIPIEESEAPEGALKDTHDLIANLSAEVARLSRKLAEVTEQADTNAKDIRTWADDYTQNKTEVADKLEMLTDDIVTLDERSQPENIAEVLAKRLRNTYRGMGRY